MLNIWKEIRKIKKIQGIYETCIEVSGSCSAAQSPVFHPPPVVLMHVPVPLLAVAGIYAS